MDIHDIKIEYQEESTSIDAMNGWKEITRPAGYYIIHDLSFRSAGMWNMNSVLAGPFEIKELAQERLIQMIEEEIVQHEKAIEKCRIDIRKVKLKAFW